MSAFFYFATCFFLYLSCAYISYLWSVWIMNSMPLYFSYCHIASSRIVQTKYLQLLSHCSGSRKFEAPDLLDYLDVHTGLIPSVLWFLFPFVFQLRIGLALAQVYVILPDFSPTELTGWFGLYRTWSGGDGKCILEGWGVGWATVPVCIVVCLCT